MEDRHTNTSTSPAEAETDTFDDLIAGWLGGAAGILLSNPLEVLKVRQQTVRTPSTSTAHHLSSSASRVGRSCPPLPKSVLPPSAAPSTSSLATAGSKLVPVPIPSFTPNAQPGLVSLWRAEGARFLFAGAAGPILGLAFIDSAFFGLYGKAMAELHQDRQDPSHLSRVFAAGATAGALCALLETPIEVVKCRAQVEPPSASGTKLGSFRIAQMIARTEGLRGFYVGGLVTAIHDGIASGGFFAAYFILRRALRGDPMLTASSPPIRPSSSSHPLSDSPPPPAPAASGSIDKLEIGRILLAGGLAGAISAFFPYPLDMIKTRLQTSAFEPTHAAQAPSPFSPTRYPAPSPATSVASPSRYLFTSSRPPPPPATTTHTPLTIRAVARGIYNDGLAEARHCPSEGRTTLSAWSERVGGLRAFSRGLGPTLVSSFVGSAVTITVFEVALAALGAPSGGGGLG